MEKEKLDVIVITQQDRFFIPKNIIKASKVCNVIEIVDNQSKNSFENKMTDMIRWFGFFQCAKMGVYTIFRIACNLIDIVSGYKAFGGTCSIKSAAKKLKVPYRIEKNLNSEEYVAHVKKERPDLIISYSAPQVIKPELLGVPRYGIINVHGALLPQYRGLLPSFWYLYNEEKLGGATVHYMSADIDDGDICEQGSVDISDCVSMFQLMKKTKLLGGELMVKAIKNFTSGDIEVRPNKSEEGSYFTWPTVEQAKEFRKKGKRLV